jgi:hypothetical protein
MSISAHFEQAQRILLALRPQLAGTKLELPATLVFQRDPLARAMSVSTTRYSPFGSRPCPRWRRATSTTMPGA